MWEWLMDGKADEQPTQNESTEDCMRNGTVKKGEVGVEQREEDGVGWSSDKQLLV